jgi:hypothetical protein
MEPDDANAPNISDLIVSDQPPPPWRFYPPINTTPPFDKSEHMPHIENFIAAIRDGVPLACPGEVGYETAVTVLKVNEAVVQAKRLQYTPDEFKV